LVEKRLSHSGRLITVAEGDLLRHITLLDQFSSQRHQDLWPCSINTAVRPGHNPNSRFTAWNWVVAVFGFVIVGLAVLGSFIPAK